MKNGVLSNFTRSHISSDRVRSGYEISQLVYANHFVPIFICYRLQKNFNGDIILTLLMETRRHRKISEYLDNQCLTLSRPRGFPLTSKNRLTLDRVKCKGALSTPSAVKGLMGT